MAQSKRPKGTLTISPPSNSPPSSSFIPAISTVAAAQVCRSVGYAAAEPAALRSLSEISSLYIQTLARSAAAIANSKGRTQSNLLDLIRAIEDLALFSKGFIGASNPTKPLLDSSALKDLRVFVRSVKEVPFATPIPKKEAPRVRVSSASFAQVGKEPPPPHVPRWLPCFPERGEIERRKERGEERKRWEEKIFEEEEIKLVGNDGGLSKKGFLVSSGERERVKFKLLMGENSSYNERRKKKRLLLVEDEE